MHYKPCCWCPMRKTCSDRELIRHLVSVMNTFDGVRCGSLKFSCKKYTDLFSPGDRVAVTLTEWFMKEVEDYFDNGSYQIVEVPEEGKTRTISGTVMFWIAGEIQIWLDEPIAFHERRNTRIKMKPNRVAKLEEPSVPVCKLCGKPEGKKNEDNYYCECDDFAEGRPNENVWWR